MSPSLSIVLPTHNRREILIEALRRLERQEDAPTFEVVIVDDGSSDDTPTAVEEFARRSPLDLRVVRQKQGGPAAARNAGLERVRDDVCLFLGDDMWAHPGLVARHARFHAQHPEREEALLGSVRWAPELHASPFVEWLNQGIQFDFASIDRPDDVPPRFFYTANVSLKTQLVREVGGFDERFSDAANEDIELAFRLHDAGMRLHYDPAALVDHFHPTDLTATLARMDKVAQGGKLLGESVRSWPVPRRPGLRHRLRAAALTVAAGVSQVPPVRERAWEFLCHEAYRESYWGVRPSDRPLLIGNRLLGLAKREEARWQGRPEGPNGLGPAGRA